MLAWLRHDLPSGVSPLDLAIALAFALIGQLELVLSTPEAYRGSAPHAVSAAAALLVSLPLIWRRQAPMAVLVTAATAIVLPRVIFDTTVLFYGGLFPVLMALFSASCYAEVPRDRLALLAPVGILAGLSLAIPSFRIGSEYAFTIAAFGGAWLAGQGTRRWRAISEKLRAALQELEATAVLREQDAVDEERARIARELHDVVGHSVSVMVLQAGAARLELLPEQTRAREQLEAVVAAGRVAMTEMRRMVGVMRPGDDAAPLAALPSLQRIEPLLRQMREAGLEVRLSVTGRECALPQSLDMCAYRIIQEALTNVVRHAGAVPVEVEIAYEPDALRLEIRNGARSTSGGSGRRVPGGGHGLLGMRERVALFDGSLEAGPCEGGGFAVRARLPRDGRAV